MYTSLLKSYTELFKDKKTKEYVKTTCGKRIRIMISSTSSLPLSVSSQWKTVTGQFRYQKCEREKENNHFALKLKTQTMNNEIYWRFCATSWLIWAIFATYGTWVQLIVTWIFSKVKIIGLVLKLTTCATYYGTQDMTLCQLIKIYFPQEENSLLQNCIFNRNLF